MNALALLKARFTSLPVQQMAEEATVKQKSVIEDMNTEQLELGQDSTGADITPTYRNPLYAQYKKMMNSKPKPRTPDLKLTGAFHSSITATADASGITIDANDQKTEMLKGKYGDAIIGLSEKNIRELQEGYILPEIKEGVFKYISEWKR